MTYFSSFLVLAGLQNPLNIAKLFWTLLNLHYQAVYLKMKERVKEGSKNIGEDGLLGWT
ncbi:hypothetical protein RchiOBHm_Chr3g0459541 [Rosa chinensis]|uniref:Uncharacterized protein n=1 Tax=Rosa chinensis TaxID=74649 RepID=A0A2P6R852_ROSCH|nr:hypothetical protein RchiOBHm_Chr3g0459541 [Rosa chinensis]